MSTTTAVKPLEETASDVHMQALQTKVLTWPELHRGDCQQDNGRLTFHSDGTGTWTATVLTYHTTNRDIWHAGFQIKGSNGATLFSVGPFDSPHMQDGNPPPRYGWVAQFSFPPDYFNGIASAVQNCSC
ncbi:DUF6294 family protein [Granulicella arctica]|uniref:DUF6294 family protein n=1 Tax=Granulicella arctica TaxID=940613 RepID=UPI0021DFA446|nr:DUF6294 family protein [Granulicella arctica]